MLKKIWKSYRLGNVIIVAITVLVFCHFLEQTIGRATYIPGVFDKIQLTILCCSILVYGNLKNDYFDQKVDMENLKSNNAYFNFSSRTNRFISFLMPVLGLVCSVILSLNSSNFFYWYWFLAYALLWGYNLYFKKLIIVGNMVVAFLGAFTVYLPYILYTNYVPVEVSLVDSQSSTFHPLTNVVLNTFFFLAFLAHFNREIIKDIIDRYGDQTMGYQTMIIKWGEKVTIPVIMFLHIALTLAVLHLFIVLFIGGYTAISLAMFSALLLLLYIFILLDKERLKLISSVYKWIMFFALISLLF